MEAVKPPEKTEDIYDPGYIRSLFDSMSKTYGFANYVTSFGFTERWRRQCVQALPGLPDHASGYDLMSGMGEAWTSLRKRNPSCKITGIDISPVMYRRSLEQIPRLRGASVEVFCQDVFQNTIPDASADFVVSSFGLKTFNDEQNDRLAKEIMRILKPGGVFSLVELSRPRGILQPFFMLYIRFIIPLIGLIFLNNADDYRMLGRYTKKFGDSRKFLKSMQDTGLDADYRSYFFGCATGVAGRKPEL